MRFYDKPLKAYLYNDLSAVEEHDKKLIYYFEKGYVTVLGEFEYFTNILRVCLDGCHFRALPGRDMVFFPRWLKQLPAESVLLEQIRLLYLY
ncbi:hypothetical protein CR203_17000 [Salipaludibacillus neizhouensis]|uniref:Uncharacterized protein n=1 Tax=Salipaludibacillus neizhouensis TaxID=885475 RepID=A0A3A9KND1_9BACI|nr:hypothetical protein [Salipaludibacillus neizhouensis]RKL66246.1 hypothetical protein CR203_17000 [Salipaludibacillus neizhouensis]